MKKHLQFLTGLSIFTLLLTACNITNFIGGNESGGNGGSTSHTHTYSSDWSYDETYHWHAATCEHTSEVKDKAEHSFGSWTIVEEAKYRVCSVCEYTEIEHEHVPGEPEILNKIEATCVSEGSYDEVVRCEICRQEISRSTHVIPINNKNHVHTTTKEENKTEATCGREGQYDEVTTCSDCGTEISKIHKTIPATGEHLNTHYEVYEKYGPFCTDWGSEYGVIVCDDCGEIIKEEYHELEPLGHDYVPEETPATYDSDGFITYTCSRCRDSYTEKTETKLEHHYSEEWTTDSQYHYHVCTDEGYEDLVINKEEHDFESTFTAPTFDVSSNAWVDGTFYRECKTCHYVHSWSITKEQYDTNIALGRFPEVSGNTVHFGLYPDNIITDADEIAALDEAKLAAHKYGNEAIFKYNGSYYRRCAAQNTSNGYTGTTSGNYYYFKMNRVRWEIVERYDDGSALLLSKWILDGGTYDDDASTYANSQLRERLSKWKSRSPLDLLFGNDGDMMESARYLMKHTVVNSGDILAADPYYGERYYSDNTEDYLHIPSLGEIRKWGEEVDKNIWLTEATSYARAMNSDINSRSVNDFYWYSSYWTRTPQSDAYVKAAYGRMTDPNYGPFYTSFGKPVTDSIGLRYCIRVQLDITKPVNFSHISTLALN